MNEAVIVDVDGTLVDVTSVRHHVLNRPKDFAAFHAGAEECPPIESTLALIRALRDDLTVFVVTARMERWRESTRRWIDAHDIGYYELLMRADGDYRADTEVKAEILAFIRRQHDVVLAIDDNPKVIDLWRSEGIAVVHVPGWAEESDAGPSGSGHSPMRETADGSEADGGSVEEPSTHLIHGPASNSCPECVQGKCRNCTGWAFDADDNMTACTCTHEEES